MKRNRLIYIENILLPCVVFSAITGTASAVAIFLFKLCSGELIKLSTQIYSTVRSMEKPLMLPLLILGAAAIGLFTGMLLKKFPECKGGGIPAATAALRGYVPFEKVRSAVIVFFSAMMTYLAGVPLGTEGPAVQIGTMLGRGTSKLFGKKHPAWNRYIMTGGACAAFSAATGAPITGIFFAFEEAHRRFTPMIFMMAAMSVSVCTAVSELLYIIFGGSGALFHIGDILKLPLEYLWISLAVGIFCGISALGFTFLHRLARRKMKQLLPSCPLPLRIAFVFVLSALLGVLGKSFIGTGHSLTEEVLSGDGVIFMLVIVFFVRAVLMILANVEGVTGGLFIPTLTFGAILGSICGKLAVSVGVLPKEHYTIIVVIGMVSFLGATSRTPITALTFAAEALSGLGNILPISIGVTVAYVIIELSGMSSFGDSVMESKTEEYNEGLTPQTFDRAFTVAKDSFVIGKEVRDILWPSSCVIVSINNNPSVPRIGAGMAEGDVLHVHYKTCHPDVTEKELFALVGEDTECQN